MIIDSSSISLDLVGGFLRGMAPEPTMSVSEWADQRRILPQTSAEAGPYMTDRTPYLREIQNRLSVRDPAQSIYVKKASQLGFTEAGNNWMGYVIDVSPAPFLYVMPTDAMMKDTSRNRIKPLIESTPTIKKKIRPEKAKNSGNKILYKEFENGFIKMVGANSPVGLASTAVRFVYLDECDRYPMNVGGEGSVIALADTRTSTYGSRKKKFVTSTPTLKGQSVIDLEFQKTGQREFHVPCPHCGAFQLLSFENLHYSYPPIANVEYICIHCNQSILESSKQEMLLSGIWIPKYPDREDGITFGYSINAMYSPLGWYSWIDMAKEYEESKDDIPKSITWTNTKKGEVYAQEGTRPQWQLLYSQRKPLIKGIVMNEVAFLTAGVDVQGDRLEIEIVGWMKGKKSQSIDYRIIMGDTSQDEVWKKLSDILSEVFTRADGLLQMISLLAVDTGYNTTKVYEFCIAQSASGKVIPVKGDDKLGMIFSAPKPMEVSRTGQKIGRVRVFRVGVSLIKTELYGFLKLLQNDDLTFPNGYCFFPEYSEEYFKGITAEVIESTINQKGYTVVQWVKSYKRNEPLDCRIYARAAASIFGLDLFSDASWDNLLNKNNHQASRQKERKPKRDSFWG